jgi:hypothetical protein
MSARHGKGAPPARPALDAVAGYGGILQTAEHLGQGKRSGR